MTSSASDLAQAGAAASGREGSSGSAEAPWAAVATSLALIAAAWIGAGSIGLLSHSLAHVLVWLALAVAVLAALPGRWGDPIGLCVLVAGAAAAAVASTSTLVPVSVLGVAVLLAAVAASSSGPERRVALTAAMAVTVFGLYCLVRTSVPLLWIATDRLGGALGRGAGLVARRPLWVGATFGGLDFLVLMAALTVCWLVLAAPPRLGRGLGAAAAIVAGHLIYLVVLACATAIPDLLPPDAPAEGWSLAGAIRTLIPWDLPVLAAGIHLAIAGAMFRWAAWPTEAEPVSPDEEAEQTPRGPWWLCLARLVAAVLLAVAIPAVTTVATGPCSAEGKKIVAFEKGFLNWLRPTHGDYGRLSIGMYGMLPSYVRSLGAEWVRSDNDSDASKYLSKKDLADADVLVLLYPNERWTGIVVKSVGKPAHGQVRIDPNEQVVLYTPNAGYRGEDSFTYTVRSIDDANDVAAANVAVTVGDAPSRPTSEPAAGAKDPGLAHQRGEKLTAADDRAEVAAGSRENAIAVLSNDTGPIDPRERIEQFVRDGGSLLVMGEHTVREGHDGSRFNDVLRGTDLKVRFDSATFAVGGWLHSYEALAHPTVAGISDERNEFGVVIGASVAAGWQARPLLVGRWGWADPGLDGAPARMGNHRYDGGEKLGDLVLAAEQPLDKGRIVVFGDTSSITNGITIGAHRFTSRLLGYLAQHAESNQALWRQVLGLALAAALIAVLAWGPDPMRTAAAALVLAASLHVCTMHTTRAAQVVPSRRYLRQAATSKPAGSAAAATAPAARPADPNKPSDLAYIDTTHMGAYSEESWRDDGIAGLEMTLIRNGYLTLSLPEFTYERLTEAGLLVSIAPARAFTDAEMDAVVRFVEKGGIFISMVGYEQREASRDLLARFGLGVGSGPPRPDGTEAPEPQPMGHFKAPYLDTGSYRVYVRFHAAWPVWCPANAKDKTTEVLAYGRGYDKKSPPVIIWRKIDDGQVVLIGDTCFAMNKNLERRGGEPFEGLRENADFWRWLLTRLRYGTMWVPPRDLPAGPDASPPAPSPKPAGKEAQR